MKSVLLAVFLFAFWLILSGHYTPMLVAAGLGCAMLSLAIAVRLRLVDDEAHAFALLPRAVTYWPWLSWEIVKSSWSVAKLVLHPKLPISPTMAVVKTSQRTAAGLATFANSITLTPGTLTVAVNEDGTLLVHALSRDGVRDLHSGRMDRRAAAFEGTR
jgi:multicomponent Na+:H+ antiporter subunit E